MAYRSKGKKLRKESKSKADKLIKVDLNHWISNILYLRSIVIDKI